LSRPQWVPQYIPALDGLRGIAVSLVVLYHCHPKLGHGLLARFAEFGWMGVNLFFVLSGFLITSIIIDGRQDAHFFRNFYARRALRIWPVYVLLLLLNYILVPCLLEHDPHRAWQITSTAPWLYYALFVQNLFPLALPGSIGPTWSLAIEEQFYLLWAPIARRISLRYLAMILIAVFVCSPAIRAWNTGLLTPTHTLIHLDGLAIGSLIAVVLRIGAFSKSAWRKLGLAGIALGLCGVGLMLVRGTAFADTFLALGFGGMLIAVLVSASGSNAYTRVLCAWPLKSLGTVSYGLYMMHILVFVVIGTFELRMQQYGTLGDVAVVLTRIVLSLGFAAALWVGFEKPILRLKRRFVSSRIVPAEPEVPVAELAAKTISAN
jgi:peptidoglycan/LPS O-acetylase OafA/YrhL